jgi:rubrerythrin
MMNWTYDSITGIPEPTKKFVPEAASTRDILILAIRMEKGSMDFYRAAQQEPKLVKVKAILEMLENAEERHMQQLYDRLSNLVDRDNLPPLDKLVQDKASYMEGGLEINKALLELEEKISGELELLEIGIQKEYMAYDFYKRAAALVTGTNSESLLHELAKQEHIHSSILLERLAQVVRQKQK